MKIKHFQVNNSMKIKWWNSFYPRWSLNVCTKCIPLPFVWQAVETLYWLMHGAPSLMSNSLTPSWTFFSKLSLTSTISNLVFLAKVNRVGTASDFRFLNPVLYDLPCLSIVSIRNWSSSKSGAFTGSPVGPFHPDETDFLTALSFLYQEFSKEETFLIISQNLTKLFER